MASRGDRLRICPQCGRATVRYVVWTEESARRGGARVWHWEEEDGAHHACRKSRLLGIPPAGVARPSTAAVPPPAGVARSPSLPPRGRNYSAGTAGRAEISAPVVVRGPLYVPVACDCGVPPWEVCKHSFPEYLDADGNPKRESA